MPAEDASARGELTCVLKTAPDADVTLKLTASDPSEGRVDPSELVFTAGNWAELQTFYLSAVDDYVDDDGKTWDVTLEVAAPSETTGYAALASPFATETITNVDNDDYGVMYTLTAPEEGQVNDGALRIRLDSEPSADVVVEVINVGPASEGIITSSALLTFSPGASDWKSMKSVTLQAVDDVVNDDAATWELRCVVTAAGETTGYATVPAETLVVTNVDNDKAHILVAFPQMPFEDASGNGAATFQLTSQPSTEVTLEVSSTDLTSGRVTTAVPVLIFRPGTWDIPQRIDIAAVDDLIDNPPPGRRWDLRTLQTTVGETTGYGSGTVYSTTVENVDDDIASVVVMPPDPASRITSESSPHPFEISLKLATQPIQPVTITPSVVPSLLPTRVEATVSNAVTFTDTDYTEYQKVAVTGADDNYADGDTEYAVAFDVTASGDEMYDGLTMAEVTATNVDNDVAKVKVDALGPAPKEGDATAKGLFTLVLTSQPTAEVTVAAMSAALGEGVVESPGSFTFEPTTWDVPQTLTVAAVDDDIDDDEAHWTVLFEATAPGELAGYEGIAVADLTVTNDDDDNSAVFAMPAGAAVTSEAGGTFRLELTLGSQPVTDVTVSPFIADATAPRRTEAKTESPALTFDSTNWSRAKTITVTGVDDDYADGDTSFDVEFKVTGDAKYQALSVPPVAATNTDDDTAGVLVSSLVGAPEEGTDATAQFTLQLTSRPTAPVTLELSGSNAQEGVIETPAQVVFTSSSWAVPKTTTVGAVDDDIDDDGVEWTVETTVMALGELTGYTTLSVMSVVVVNVDDDEAGVSVATPTGTRTTESGGEFVVEVVLDSEPLDRVIVVAAVLDVASPARVEAVAAPGALTFFPRNWDERQVMTVAGVDDDYADGDTPYSVALSASGDSAYEQLQLKSIAAVNEDNDVLGLSLSPLSRRPEEGGGASSQAEMTIALSSRPTGTVTVALQTSDPAEGTIESALSLAFDEGKWAVPQTVTVAAVDDEVDDDGKTWSITIVVLAPVDTTGYAAVVVPPVVITNVDDDAAGIMTDPVNPTGLSVTEHEVASTFTVRLTSEPTAPVTLTVTSSDVTEGVVNPATVTFTATDAATLWANPQTVTVTGVNDDIDDGDQSLFVSVAALSGGRDSKYAAISAAPVLVTCFDDDEAGVQVTLDGAMGGVGMLDESADGVHDLVYTVKLRSEPTMPVTVTVSVSDATEGEVVAPPLPHALVFAPSAWAAQQQVTVRRKDDDVADGAVSWRLVHGAISADPTYNMISIADVDMITTDDDTHGFIIEPRPSTPVELAEAGGTSAFTIVLRSRPTATVVVPLASTDPSECVVSTDRLLFTREAWAQRQTVTVTGVDDVVQDGRQPCAVVCGRVRSADIQYNAVAVPDVQFEVLDDDIAGLVVSATTAGPSGMMESTATSEHGAMIMFSVKLSSKPTDDVTVATSSSDPSEGVVLPPRDSLTFTDRNWYTARTVTVVGEGDEVADGDVAYTITTTPLSHDTVYNALTPTLIVLTNTEDDDEAGVAFGAVNGPTTEDYGMAKFTVVLTSQPVGAVTVLLTTSDMSEGNLVIPELIFSQTTWSMPQTATVTGVPDHIVDGDQAYKVLATCAAEEDATYAGLTLRSVDVLNRDTDVAGVEVKLLGGRAAHLETTEAGLTNMFQVRLATRPRAASLEVRCTSRNPAEGTASPAKLQFSGTDWDVWKTVMVTGVDDDVDDGDVAYEVACTLAGTQGLNVSEYRRVQIPSVAVVNVDDDTAGFLVSDLKGTTTVDGGAAFFTVRLTSKPAQQVTVPISANDPHAVSISTSELVFTPQAWQEVQTVTVTGVDGDIGDASYKVELGAAASGDPKYAGRRPAAVSGAHSEDDGEGDPWVFVVVAAVAVLLLCFALAVGLRKKDKSPIPEPRRLEHAHLSPAPEASRPLPDAFAASTDMNRGMTVELQEVPPDTDGVRPQGRGRGGGSGMGYGPIGMYSRSGHRRYSGMTDKFAAPHHSAISSGDVTTAALLRPAGSSLMDDSAASVHSPLLNTAPSYPPPITPQGAGTGDPPYW